MFWKAAMLLMMFFAPLATPDVPVDWFPVAGGSDDFYIATDTLPGDISPDTLTNLYDYLKVHVAAHPDSEFLPWVGSPPPVLVRFVNVNSRLPFPHGTESYGGMMGWAYWDCLPMAGLCRLLDASETPGEDVVVALVAATPNRAENLGLVAHELSHVLGSVDGPRCPYHEDYHPSQTLPSDPSDAYWWYGVTGVFTLVPVGVVWDALNNNCTASGEPVVCGELQAIINADSAS